MLQHIALLQRFHIRDHEEDIIERGLIEAERKLSLAHEFHKTQHSVMHKCNPIRILCSPHRVIEPSSWIRKLLNFLQSICMLYIAFILPFELFFVHYNYRTYSFSSRPPLMVGIELGADMVFIFNFISRFYTPFIRQDDGVWEVLPHRIALHNLKKSDFIFTLFAIMPFSIVAIVNGESMFLLVWRFLQVAARYYSYKSIESNFLLETELRAGEIGFLHNLFSTIILILGFLHWSTCFWFYLHPSEEIERIQALNYVAFHQSQAYESAISPDSVEKAIVDSVAILFEIKVAFYLRFAYETLSIVIGESMEAYTPRQYFFLYTMSFIGVCMIAGLFGQVGSIIASYSKERIAYLEKMKDIARTMRYLQLPEELKSRVIRYHEYVHNIFGTFDTNKLKTFADKLSKPLAAEVKLHCHTNLIKNVPLFDKLDHHISRYLIDCLTVEIYMPGDFVIRQGEFDSRLYMIMKGTCHVLIRGNPRPVRTLKAGDYFGEVSLVTRVARSATVRAQSFCNFAVIAKEDYDAVKADNQAVFAETERVMMERLDSYKGINKKSQHIKRFSESEDSADKKKGKLRRRSKEPVHKEFTKNEGNEKSNEVTPSEETDASASSTSVAFHPPRAPQQPKLPPLDPPSPQQEENSGSNHAGEKTHRISLATDVKIMQKLRKSEKKARKKIAHHISHKLSDVIAAQEVLKETIQRNERNIQKILDMLSKGGDITHE